MDNQSDLLKEKDRLIKEYQVACKAGIHDSYLYNRIMEINNRIMRHNRWALKGENEHEQKTINW